MFLRRFTPSPTSDLDAPFPMTTTFAGRALRFRFSSSVCLPLLHGAAVTQRYIHTVTYPSPFFRAIPTYGVLLGHT